MKPEPCRRCGGDGKEPNNEGIGKILASKRSKAKKSQKVVAAKLRISQAYLCELEKGRRRWTSALINDFEKAITKL